LAIRDRRSLAAQVRDDIAAMIVSERYEPNRQVPTEGELAQRFDVSRSTIREALKQLEQEHLIYCVHGVGRFVAPSSASLLEQDITQLTSVSELASSLGITLEARLLDFRTEPASAELARDLGIVEGEPVCCLERARTAMGEPVIVSIDMFPRALCTTELRPERFTGSLLEVMAEWGVELAYARTTVKAATLEKRVAKAVGLPLSLPWILLEQVNYNERNQPVLASRDYHRGDLFRFNVLRRRRRFGAPASGSQTGKEDELGHSRR